MIGLVMASIFGGSATIAASWASGSLFSLWLAPLGGSLAAAAAAAVIASNIEH